MPVDPVTGKLIAFTADQIAAMQIEDTNVRDGAHPTETRELDQSTMTRAWLVAWAERYNFVELCLGDSKTWDDSGTTRISRLLPDVTYGRHPTFPQIVATKVQEIRGHSLQGLDSNKIPRYARAKVTLFYEHLPVLLVSDNPSGNDESARYVRRGPSSGDTEAFTLPGAAFKYVKSGGGGASGVPIPFNISITRPVRRFVYYWEMVPHDCFTTGGAVFTRVYQGEGDGVPFAGTVNKTDLAIGADGTYPAGTVLFEKAEEELVRSPLAASGAAGWRWRIGFHFAYTPRGWLDLFFFDPTTPANSGWYRASVSGTYYAVGSVPDNDGLYNVRDLNKLFDPNI